jgi:hypothetical protein
MTAAYWVWRRELAVMLRAPIIYLVGGLFLVVQGIAFAALVGTLSDMRRAALLGELLEGQLAGTLLTWALELVVLTLLGMRTIAEDKRSGSWEALLTARVGEGAAVVGKWLAAVTVYAVIWVPTLSYLAVLAVFRSDRGGWDAPAIAVGYGGAIVLGAALLAWAVAASAATTSALAAGALGFAWLIAMFLVGELPSLWPGMAVDHPGLALALETISLRAIATDFARGHVALRSVAVLAGVTAVGLFAATTLACAGRRRLAEVRIRVLGTIACAAIAISVCILAARHPVGLDLSAARRNTLDDSARAVLASLPGPAVLTIVQPTLGGLEPIYDEVARVAARMAEVAPALTVQRSDPVSVPGGLGAIARAAGLATDELASSGAVVVELAGERRVVDVFALGAFGVGPDGGPIVERLAIEQALAGALAALSTAQPITVCATRGHGEMALEPQPSGDDWAAVAQRLRGEGMALREVEVAPAVPAGCTVVVVAGPSQPLRDDEALALQRFVRDGRGLVVAARGGAAGTLPPTGLEGVLVAEGIGLAPAVAIDPQLERQLPGTLVVLDGYVDHPINRGFARTRRTLWRRPRVVVAERGARPLVVATSASWGEHEPERPEKHSDDIAGPVALAAIGAAHRVIALGGADSLTTAALRSGLSASDLWLARAIRFASGVAEPAIAARDRAPEQVRLIMTTGERRVVIALSVAGIPLAWMLLGGLVVWWRRRRAR